ncbi:hypothetical protein ABVT39_003775 [Epinephelus coioides]
MSSCSQSSESETCTSGSSGFHESTSSTLSPGVNLVKPAPPECHFRFDDNKAINMRSVGVVMAYILLAVTLFPGSSEYDTLRSIVDLLGVPPHHLLSDGMFSNIYFVEGPSDHWRLRRPQEFWLYITPPGDYRA